MGTATIHFDAPVANWRRFWRQFTSPSAQNHCVHTGTLWQRVRLHSPGVLFAGVRYCIDHCLDHALAGALPQLLTVPHRPVAPHRIPLGLLLLSRQQITAGQLQLALQTQRAKGSGRIGEWLQSLGFASETQITAALARQWSCAVLRTSSPVSQRAPQLPLSLLKHFVMLPVQYVEATSSLHLAFAEGVDYSVLYAIEQMIGCHTEPCMASPTFIRFHLQVADTCHGDSEVVFDSVSDIAEACRIVRSYCLRVGASEVRLASCPPYLWIRLLRPSFTPFDLCLRLMHESRHERS